MLAGTHGQHVRQRRFRDRVQRLAGQERLVRRDEHVREREEPGKHVVVDDLVTAVLEEQVTFPSQ